MFTTQRNQLDLDDASSLDQQFTDSSSIYPISEESGPYFETGSLVSPSTPSAFFDAPESLPGTPIAKRPGPIDIASLIAGIDDASTSWGANFWVVLSDPITACTFYACPATGDCSWDAPVGAMVLPRSVNGEYWELKDESRGGKKYYYHTGTGKVMWNRPSAGELVIPLGMIQMNALQDRTHQDIQSGTENDTPLNNRNINRTPKKSASHRQMTPTKSAIKMPGTSPIRGHTRIAPRPPLNPEQTDLFSPSADHNGLAISSLTKHQTAHSKSDNELVSNQQSALKVTFTDPYPLSSYAFYQSSPSLPSSTSLPVHQNLPLPEAIKGSETEKDNGWMGWGGKRSRKKSTTVVQTLWVDPDSQDSGGKSGQDSLQPPKFRYPLLRKKGSDISLKSTSAPAIFVREAPSIPPLPGQGVGMIKEMKRLSTGLHPTLAEQLSNSIKSFTTEQYTKDYFATQRRGVLRRKIPDDQIMVWQDSVITGPLLSKTTCPHGEILQAFKIIQHIMGDRDRPVEGIMTVQSSTSAFSMADMAQSQEVSALGADNTGGIWNKAEKRLMLEEERWLLQLGLNIIQIRDEVYAMCMKQVTKNPVFSSTLRGYQLICVLVVTFGPSREFEPYVRSFLQTSQSEGDPTFRTIALHCKRKLDKVVRTGPRTRAPMYGEIEHAFSAAFHPSIFGETIEFIMQQQGESGSTLAIPKILPFLAESIIDLGGMKTESIFRQAGDPDSIGEMKARLDRGEYHLKGVTDPHVLTSLLKLWLRELDEPVIPEELYDEGLKASRDSSISCEFLKLLPAYPRRIMIYLIGFLQSVVCRWPTDETLTELHHRMFMKPKWVQHTKMTPGSLALVIAPNVLRPVSRSSNVVFANTAYETALIVNLLETLDVMKVDLDYVPLLPEVPLPRVANSTMTLFTIGDRI